MGPYTVGRTDGVLLTPFVVGFICVSRQVLVALSSSVKKLISYSVQVRVTSYQYYLIFPTSSPLGRLPLLQSSQAPRQEKLAS